jgi:hypothetical protein
MLLSGTTPPCGSYFDVSAARSLATIDKYSSSERFCRGSTDFMAIVGNLWIVSQSWLAATVVNGLKLQIHKELPKNILAQLKENMDGA